MCTVTLVSGVLRNDLTFVGTGSPCTVLKLLMSLALPYFIIVSLLPAACEPFLLTLGFSFCFWFKKKSFFRTSSIFLLNQI